MQDLLLRKLPTCFRERLAYVCRAAVRVLPFRIKNAHCNLLTGSLELHPEASMCRSSADRNGQLPEEPNVTRVTDGRGISACGWVLVDLSGGDVKPNNPCPVTSLQAILFTERVVLFKDPMSTIASPYRSLLQLHPDHRLCSVVIALREHKGYEPELCSSALEPFS